MTQAVSIHAHHTASISTRDLQRAERRQVRQQAVRELRDGEHEHQVEEQLDVGDAAVLVAAAGPKMIGARRKRISAAEFGRH